MKSPSRAEVGDPMGRGAVPWSKRPSLGPTITEAMSAGAVGRGGRKGRYFVYLFIIDRYIKGRWKGTMERGDRKGR